MILKSTIELFDSITRGEDFEGRKHPVNFFERRDVAIRAQVWS